MAAFEITLDDRTEMVDDADGYDLEGPLTTFFRSERGHATLDSWSVRIASFRSTDVQVVRRLDGFAGSATFTPVMMNAAG